MDQWIAALRQFVPGYMHAHPVLRLLTGCSVVALHGSTTRGVVDDWSDLDLWVLAPPQMLAEVDARSPTRFFDFSLHGKPGHFNVESLDDFKCQMQACRLPLINELRHSIVLTDVADRGAALLATARQPMPEPVSRAWFQHHYVEMRGEHRACDNPIERGDAAAVLMAMTTTMSHALQAAMVLDGEPYPYVKWLAQAASQTPTGARIAAIVAQMLNLLGQDALRLPGPEKQYPLSTALREMRRVLIEAARQRGIHEPWLTHWYLSIHAAREATHKVSWPPAPPPSM
jgi:hypothetical protein